MPRGCRICKFFEDYPYKLSEKELFEKKAREGTSLRQLSLLLEAYNLKANKDTISKHIKVCMGIDVSTQRAIEKDIKKEGIRAIGRKVKEFFVRPSEVVPLECPHNRIRLEYGTPIAHNTGRAIEIPLDSSEKVKVVCSECGKVLDEIDPEEVERRKRKGLDHYDYAIYRSLTRK